MCSCESEVACVFQCAPIGTVMRACVCERVSLGLGGAALCAVCVAVYVLIVFAWAPFSGDFSESLLFCLCSLWSMPVCACLIAFTRGHSLATSPNRSSSPFLLCVVVACVRKCDCFRVSAIRWRLLRIALLLRYGNVFLSFCAGLRAHAVGDWVSRVPDCGVCADASAHSRA